MDLPYQEPLYKFSALFALPSKEAVCVFLVFVSRCMRPEGPWQLLAAALTDSSAFLTSPTKDQILSPTTGDHTGATPSPSSHIRPTLWFNKLVYINAINMYKSIQINVIKSWLYHIHF